MIDKLRLGLAVVGGTAFLIIFIVMGKSSTPADGSNLVPELHTAKIIPDVLSDATDAVPFTVTYQGKPVKSGVQLSPDFAADEPEITIKGQDTYALVMLDPDAPSPNSPKYRHYLHWLVVNIPGVDIKRGEVLIDYAGPTPPQGKHRYVFLLYKQSGRISEDPPAHRNNWDLKAFVSNNKLSSPANVVYFYAQPE